MVKFGFGNSGEEFLGKDCDDSMTMYDSDSDDDDEHYLWQPPPDVRRQTAQRFYKVLLVFS